MAYKVIIDKDVLRALNRIEVYCVIHFGNYDFAKKLLKEILEFSYKQYPLYYESIRRVVFIDLGYYLYFYVNEEEKVIWIYDLKSFKQRQSYFR